jgi:putative methyltransferase (TIGR04325 family)
MTLKELIKYLLFSPFIDGVQKKVRGIRTTTKKQFTGFYDDWNAVIDENPWIGEGWIEKSKQKLENSKNVNSSLLTVPPNATRATCYSIPALIINQISSQGSCNVLDFGGGTGDVYYQIKRSLLHSENLNYYVMDNQVLMEVGEEYKEENDRIVYCKNIPDKVDFDIVLISTTLQYIDKYKEWLEPVINLRPKYLLFMRLWAGDFPSDFITSEVVHGKKTPARIINYTFFIDHMRSLNYSVLFQGPCTMAKDKERFEGIPEKFLPLFDLNVVLQKN